MTRPERDDDRERFTARDGLRYGLLAFFASLLFLVFVGRNTTALASLLAVYVLIGVAAAVWFVRRRGWL